MAGTVRSATRPKKGQPAGNSRRRTTRAASAATPRKRRDITEINYQRGLKGQDFEEPFDDDAVPAARAAWESGRGDRAKSGRKQDRQAKRSSAAQGVRSKARSYAKPTGRQAAVRRARARKLTTAANQLTRPAVASITTASQAIFLTLVVVALYLVLSNTGPLTGFLGGAGRALEWLSRPDKSIPYGQK